MKENPAPNTYLSDYPESWKHKGPSFGISYKHFEKTGIIGSEPLKKSKLLANQLIKNNNYMAKTAFGW